MLHCQGSMFGCRPPRLLISLPIDPRFLIGRLIFLMFGGFFFATSLLFFLVGSISHAVLVLPSE